MIKEKDIVIRIDKELKEKVRKAANLCGLSMSSYIRMILSEKHK